MIGWEKFVEDYFNWDVISRYLPAMFKGALITIELAVLVVICGIALGLALALIRAYRIRAVNILLVIFVDVLRALPPLALISFYYFGLPYVGVTMSAFLIVWLTLTLVLAAFAEEIFWAGILSIEAGQWQAARSTGLSYTQALIHVVMPQAVRMTVPPLTNRTIAITKNTALGMVIGVEEILYQATTAQSFSGNASPLMVASIMFLIIFLPVVTLGRWIERRYAWRKN